MPKFSKRSIQELETCDERIQRVLHDVIEEFDFVVLEGHRSKERQAELKRDGLTQTMNSRHLEFPSAAVDIAPYPVDWSDRERFTYLAGFVVATAASMGIKLRWGGDWDGDRNLHNNFFDDLCHFELVDD